MVQIKIDTFETNQQSYDGKRDSTSGQKHGKGILTVEASETFQKYVGSFTDDNFHGECTYTQTKPGNSFSYEGTMYANEFEGYAKVIHGNCAYFEGIYKGNRRFGPGVVSYADGSQDVGFWMGSDLMRLAIVVKEGTIPKLATTANGKIEILQNRKLCSLVPHSDMEEFDFNVVIPNNFVRNRNSVFFNHAKYDLAFFGTKERSIQVTKPEHDFSKLEKILSSVKVLEHYTPKELCLLQKKFAILSALLSETSMQFKYADQEIEVTDLLAWNNENYMMEVLKECFRHRHREPFVNFGTSKILQGQRSGFKKPGYYETACKLHLELCSEDKDVELIKLRNHFGVNPDLTDSEGNSGVFFAAAKDNVHVLKRLVNMGANLDHFNDENITILNLCLLRYISIMREIHDWERAFLVTLNANNPYEDLSNWMGFNAMVSHSYIEHAASFCKWESESIERKDLIQRFLHGTTTDTHPLDWFFEGNTSVRNFQSTYMVDIDTHEDYLFNLGYPEKEAPKENRKKPQDKGKTKKAKVQDRSEDAVEAMFNLEKARECEVVLNTIEVILRLGANPNLCRFPMPTILLGLYSDNPKIFEMLIDVQADISELYTTDNLNLFHILCSMPPTENMFKLGNILLKTSVDPRLRCGPGHWKELIEKIEGNPNYDPSDKGPKITKKGKKSSKTVERQLEEQRESLKVDEIPEGPQIDGKTPLHLLVLRGDYDKKNESSLCNLGRIIARRVPGALNDLYLGHTPLSLAVLKGNSALIKALLEMEADINTPLGENIGNLFTIYGLKRYGMPNALPPVATCKEILHLLVLFGGNPCLPIGKYGNALEFIEADNAPPEIVEGDEIQRTSEKVAKNKRLKNEQISAKKFPGKDGKNKLSPQYEIKNYLLDLIKSVILTQLRGKLTVYLLSKVLEGTIENYKHLIPYLDHNDVLGVIAYLVAEENLDLRRDSNYFMTLLFLEYVDKYGSKLSADEVTNLKMDKIEEEKKIRKQSLKKDVKGSSKKAGKFVEMKTSSYSEIGRSQTNQDILDALLDNMKAGTLPHTFFELDKNLSNYKTCYHCGLKTGKTLIACPTCGLVYFCSQQCNVDETKIQSAHPCKDIFYDKELQNLNEYSVQKQGTINNLENTFRKIQPLMLISQKHHPIFAKLIGCLQECGSFDNKNIPEDVTGYLSQIGLQLDNLKFNKNQYTQRKRLTELTDMVFKKHSANLSEMFAVPLKIKNISHKSLEDLMLMNIKNTSTLYSSVSVFSDGWDSAPQTIPFKTNISDDFANIMHSSRETSSVQKTLSSYMPLSTIIPQGIQRLSSDSNQMEDKKKKENRKVVKKVKHKVPPKLMAKPKSSAKLHPGKPTASKLDPFSKAFCNQQFLDTLCRLFPDFDFQKAMAPFVCYSDTQFYYKFGDKMPQYFSTHM